MTVFVAIFVIASTLGLSVQQRQQELALLRSIGATPRQIRAMVRREALVVAVGAAILGCAPGVFLGPLLYRLVSAAGVISPVVEFHQGFMPYLAAPAIGIFAALVAAYVASRRPAKIRPTAGIAEAALRRTWVSWPRVVFSLLFFAGGFALILVTTIVMEGAVASATAGPAVMCWAISIALISPGLTRLLAAVLSPPVRAFFGLAGYLGTINVRTRAVRVAAAVTPIMLAVGHHRLHRHPAAIQHRGAGAAGTLRAVLDLPGRGSGCRGARLRRHAAARTPGDARPAGGSRRRRGVASSATPATTTTPTSDGTRSRCRLRASITGRVYTSVPLQRVWR